MSNKVKIDSMERNKNEKCFLDSLIMIIDTAKEIADKHGAENGMGCLSNGDYMERYYAVANTAIKVVAVAGNHCPSDYLKPLNIRQYLTMFKPILPEGWELDIVPCSYFEFDEEGNMEAVGCTGPVKKRTKEIVH